MAEGGGRLDSEASLTFDGVDEMEGLGSSLGLSDVDGDGLDDVWIGANQGETSVKILDLFISFMPTVFSLCCPDKE